MEEEGLDGRPTQATPSMAAEHEALLPSLLPVGSELPHPAEQAAAMPNRDASPPGPSSVPSPPEEKSPSKEQPKEQPEAKEQPKEPDPGRKHKTDKKKTDKDEPRDGKRTRDKETKREAKPSPRASGGDSHSTAATPTQKAVRLPPLSHKPAATLLNSVGDDAGIPASITGRLNLSARTGAMSPATARQKLAHANADAGDGSSSSDSDESRSVSDSGRSSRSVSSTFKQSTTTMSVTNSRAMKSARDGTDLADGRTRLTSGKGSQMPPPPARVPPPKPAGRLEALADRVADGWYKMLGKERPRKNHRHHHHKKHHHRWIKLSPREKQGLAFIFSELLLVAAFLLQLGTFRSWLVSMEKVQVSGEVGLLDLTFSLRHMHMSNGFKGQSANPAIVSLLTSGGGTQEERDAVKTILAGEITGREIEFATLMTAEGKILVSANNNRSGETWDAATERVGRVTSGAVTQIRSVDLISYAELIQEGPPLFRSRFLDTQMTSLNHLYDTRDAGLITYVVTSVKDANGSPVGALVSGDLSNGKTLTPFLAVRGLGSGYAGLYHRSMKHDGYLRACSFLSTKLALGQTTYTSEVDPVPQALLAAAENDPYNRVITAGTQHFAFAAKRIESGMVDGVLNSTDTTPGVVVRGLARVDSTLFDDVYTKCSICLAVVILVNLLALYISLTTFVMPLERLASKLKHSTGGAKVDLSDLKSQRMNMTYMIRVAVTAVVALAMCVLMYEEVATGLRDFLQSKAVSALGVSRVAWDIKVDQMGLGFRGVSTYTNIRKLLDHQNSSALINATSKALRGQQELRKIEYTVLLNSSLNIIATGDLNSPLLGTKFDPARGIASAALATGLRYKRTAVVPYSDVESEPSRPVFAEKLSASTPNSKLAVDKTKGYALVRFTSTPVRAASSALTDKPDGVLISGEILNGKTIMIERALNILGLGYAAVYLKKPDGSGYSLVVSAARFVNTPNKLTVDVPAPESILRAVDAHGGQNVAKWVKVEGKKFVLAASRVPLDRVLTEDGDRDDYEYNGQELPEEPEAFIVFGKEVKETAAVALHQTLWSLLAALVQLGTTAYLNWMAYRPMQKLLSVMEGRGFISRRKPRTLREQFRDGKDELFRNWRSIRKDPKAFLAASRKAAMTKLRPAKKVLPAGADFRGPAATTATGGAVRPTSGLGNLQPPLARSPTAARLV